MINLLEFIKFFKGYQLKYVGKTHERNNVYSFFFKPLYEWKWQAGQHMMIDLPVNGKIVRKMFSLSSAPHENDYRITTRFLDDKASDFKKALFHLPEGTIIKGHGPVGNLKLTDETKHHVFIAAGIGITPFRSILKDLEYRKLNTLVTLLYQNSDDSFIFKDELNKIVKRNKNIKVKYIVKPDIIDKKILRETTLDSDNAIFGISGPKGFIESIKSILKDIGVKSKQIKTDAFLGLNT